MNEDKAAAVMLGLGIGDALGYPAEFRSRARILREIGPEGITDFIELMDDRFTGPIILGVSHPPGTYTDDTQMSIAVARGLLSAGDKDIDALMTRIGEEFVEWSRSPDNNRAPGETCMTGCYQLAKGIHWKDAGRPNSKGCGSAMRASPIGIYYSSLDDVDQFARAQSIMTHGHDAALAASAAAAILVAMGLQNATPQDMYQEVMRRCSPSSKDFSDCFSKIPSVLHLPPEDVLIEGVLGESWIAEEAVASAMYCVWRSPNDFSKAVLTAVNTDGDSDSIAAITGSIMGALVGLEGIPEKWRREVEDASLLDSLGRQLWRKRSVVGSCGSVVSSQ
jgi:ADP-ribosylglycohydrolase